MFEITDSLNGLVCCNHVDGEVDRDSLQIRGVIKLKVASPGVEPKTINLEDVVVCKSFGYTPEILATDAEGLAALVAPVITPTSRFFKSIEGSIVRVWQIDGNWYMSTHRKINAFKSRWGHHMNFGELFCRALTNSSSADLALALNPTNEENTNVFAAFTKLLQPSKIYMLIIKNFVENRKVCEGGAEPELICTGSFDRDKDFAFSMDNPETLLSYPEEIAGLTTLDSVVEATEALDYKSSQGIFIVNPDAVSAKVINSSYNSFDKLRANVENVLYRYVQLRITPSHDAFVALYPERLAQFRTWENVMLDIYKHMHAAFIKRLRRQPGLLQNEQHKALLQIFPLLLKGPRNFDYFQYTMNTRLEERELNALYKSYMYRQHKTGNGNSLALEQEQQLMQKMIKNKVSETQQ
jgi:hypothetical protein